MAYTRDWDETTPTNATPAKQIDDYNRYLREDVAERLEDHFYGFTAGENSLAAHCKSLRFYNQGSHPSAPAAGYYLMYLYGGELWGIDANANRKQFTDSGVLKLVGGSDVTLTTLKNTILNDTMVQGVNAAASGYVDLFKITTGDILRLAAGAQTASTAAPTADAGVANKKYVDDAIVTADAAAAAAYMAKSDAFGGWTTTDSESNNFVFNGTYLAQADGIFTLSATNLQGSMWLMTDGSSPATAVRARIEPISSLGGIFMSTPVKKDDYLTISGNWGTATLTCNWVPFGTGDLVKQ